MSWYVLCFNVANGPDAGWQIVRLGDTYPLLIKKLEGWGAVLFLEI